MPSSASSASAADHPRPRGVYGGGGGVSLGAAGSSPPARGLRAGAWCPPRWCRIIPARAGFTLGWACRHRLGWDHPRPRGVYAAELRRRLNALGSSPPARGLRFGGAGGEGAGGIIPARAGFTLLHVRRGCRCWDHPRPRGVYAEAADAHDFSQGSSPPARGLLAVTCTPHGGVEGSSPPARGLRGGLFSAGSGDRIIPARAGFTCWRRPRGRRLRDHPRPRGVYASR